MAVKTLLRALSTGWPRRAVGAVDSVSRLASVIAALLWLAGVVGLAALAEGLLGLLSAIALSLGVLAVIALSAATSLQRRIDALERPVLTIASPSDDRSCHQEFWEGVAPAHWLTNELYRVRVENRTLRTIEAVSVVIEGFTPQGASFLPLPLQMLGDTGPAWLDSRQGRPLHPGGVAYYNVAGLQLLQTGSVGPIWLGYAANEPNQISPDRRYEFALAARGRDVPLARRTFVAWLRSQRLYFCALEDEATHPQRVTLPG